MDALTSPAIIPYLLRWAHIIFGIMWIGHLYFFNLVNVPFQGDLAKELKPQVNPKLLLRAFYWFRWSAMYTLILGLCLFVWHYITPENAMRSPDGQMTGRAMWIQFGMLLGIIMWFNVWFIIWPAQKKILGGMISGSPPPDAPAIAARAGKASRFNTYASGPMLFGMVAATHLGTMTFPVLIAVTVVGLGFWVGMIKRSFKVKTTV